MTKEDFKRIPELRREIARALNLWESAIESATRTTTVITGMPKGKSISSQVENAVIKSEVYKERYDALCEEQKDIYRRLKQESKKLSEQEAKAMQLIFPQGKKMYEVARELQVTERHAYRIKHTAIYKLTTFARDLTSR